MKEHIALGLSLLEAPDAPERAKKVAEAILERNKAYMDPHEAQRYYAVMAIRNKIRAALLYSNNGRR